MLKKNLPVVFAFVLGGLIIYLVVSLKTAKQELNQAFMDSHDKENHTNTVEPHDPAQDKAVKNTEKHWLDERIKQQSAETEKRTKQQQSQGDKMKSLFDQFSNNR